MRYVPLELLPELEAAIAVELEHCSWARRRDALGVALGLHGLRVGEVRRARRADLYVAGCRLSVARFKRGMAREIPLDQRPTCGSTARPASWSCATRCVTDGADARSACCTRTGRGRMPTVGTEA